MQKVFTAQCSQNACLHAHAPAAQETPIVRMPINAHSPEESIVNPVIPPILPATVTRNSGMPNRENFSRSANT